MLPHNSSEKTRSSPKHTLQVRLPSPTDKLPSLISHPGVSLILEQLHDTPGPLLIITSFSPKAWKPFFADTAGIQIIGKEDPHPDSERVFQGNNDNGWEPFHQTGAPPPGVGVIVLHDAIQYMDPLYALASCHDILKPHGKVLVTGTFSRTRPDLSVDKYPFLPFFLNQIKRCGFKLERQEDVGCISNLTQKQQPKPVNEDSRRNTQFIALERAGRPKYRLATADNRHSQEIASLFKQVFGHKMSTQWRTWKYGNGRGKAVVVYRDGQMVGHYGGVKRDVLFGGVPLQAMQPVDVMVLPSDRYARGPFYLAATTFLEQNMGYGTLSPIGFGFPNQRAMRLGETLKIYYEVDRICEVRWPAKNDYKQDLIMLSDRIAHTKLDKIVNNLWVKMQKDLSKAIIGVRDATYIRHRYTDHPGINYDLLTARHRITRRHYGLVVLKREEQECQLMDFVGPLVHLPLLINLARNWVHERQLPELYTWITASKKQHFASTQGQIRSLDISIPGNRWTIGPAEQKLRDRWWLTPGDTDFL